MNQSRNSLPLCFITLDPIVSQNEPTKTLGSHDCECEQYSLSACDDGVLLATQILVFQKNQLLPFHAIL
jgi:hypothetical protein